MGIAWGFIYIIVVLLTLWIPGNNSTIIAASTGAILILIGFYLSPPGLSMLIVITNRSLSIGGIFVTMYGILKYKGKEKLATEQSGKLEKLNEELKETNSELENFAYVASHDLQEPLRKIQSFGDRVMAKEGDKISEEGKDYISRMMNAASRMQILVNDLLSYSRLRTKEKPFEKIDLNLLLKGVVSDLEIAIEKSGAKIEIENLPVIDGDSTQIRQLFQNLIANAIKFRNAMGNPVIKITFSKLSNYFFEIQVSDNGIGFDQQYEEKIFQFFQRLDGSKYEGSGIGLAVCRKIVQRHRGAISAKSKLGEGSTFRITLPIFQVKAA